MFARIRKAIIAGFAAGITGAIGAISTVLQDGKFDGAGDFGIILGAYVAAFAVTAYATYKVPNMVTPNDVNSPSVIKDQASDRF